MVTNVHKSKKISTNLNGQDFCQETFLWSSCFPHTVAWVGNTDFKHVMSEQWMNEKQFINNACRFVSELLGLYLGTNYKYMLDFSSTWKIQI